jgi:hypothetical protein
MLGDEPCPYCGGDESKCDFDYATEHCTEMLRVFEAIVEHKKLAQAHFRVEVRKGWSWVVGYPVPVDAGPWRYRWEAQEYADELNAKLAHGECGRSEKDTE